MVWSFQRDEFQKRTCLARMPGPILSPEVVKPRAINSPRAILREEPGEIWAA
jgi:hypothetical protein